MSDPNTPTPGFAAKVYDWRAKRSGASITINAKTHGGESVQITEVALIEPSVTAGSGAVATRRNGQRYWLADRNALG